MPGTWVAAAVKSVNQQAGWLQVLSPGTGKPMNLSLTSSRSWRWPGDADAA